MKSMYPHSRAEFVASLCLPLIFTAHDVVIERNVNLRPAPDADNDPIQLLKRGSRVRLLDLEKQGGYYRVLHKAGIGWDWTFQRKEEYANDLDNPEHLIAVSASANRSKSDKGPDRWMPPDTSYHCQYVADWQAIKQQWELDMSVQEAEAVVAIREDCP